MHRIAVAALAAFAFAGTPADARSPAKTLSVDGVRVSVPSGWRRTGRLSDCSQPHQVFALVRSRHELSIGDASRYKGGLILLLEGPGNPFPPRQLLRLPAAPTRFEGCCDQPTGPGYEFTFRDSERNFYAFVFAENRRVANDAVAILDTLRVSLA